MSSFRNLLHHHVHIARRGRRIPSGRGSGPSAGRRLEAAGGFDAERYPAAAVEDIELGMRLAAPGGRSRSTPRSGARI